MQYLMNMAKQSQNPFSLMQRLAGNNPQAQQIVKNLQGMKPEEWQEYANNMAKGMNTTPIDFLKQNFPMEFLRTLGIQ